MNRFAWKEAGWSFDQGPVVAESLDEAKAKIRAKLGVKRLPKGISIWNLADRPMARYRVIQQLF